jgi:hypothetical protein
VFQIVQEQLWFTNILALLANVGILLLGLAGLFVAREHWRTRVIKIGIMLWLVWSVINPLIAAPLRFIPFLVIFALFAYAFATNTKARDAKSI